MKKTKLKIYIACLFSLNAFVNAFFLIESNYGQVEVTGFEGFIAVFNFMSYIVIIIALIALPFYQRSMRPLFFSVLGILVLNTILLFIGDDSFTSRLLYVMVFLLNVMFFVYWATRKRKNGYA